MFFAKIYLPRPAQAACGALIAASRARPPLFAGVRSQAAWIEATRARATIGLPRRVLTACTHWPAMWARRVSGSLPAWRRKAERHRAADGLDEVSPSTAARTGRWLHAYMRAQRRRK
jgi:hypothetical protein